MKITYLYVGKDYDTVALAEEFTTALEAELDFTVEANYTEQLRSNLILGKLFGDKGLICSRTI